MNENPTPGSPVFWSPKTLPWANKKTKPMPKPTRGGLFEPQRPQKKKKKGRFFFFPPFRIKAHQKKTHPAQVPKATYPVYFSSLEGIFSKSGGTLNPPHPIKIFSQKKKKFLLSPAPKPPLVQNLGGNRRIQTFFSF